MTTPPRRSGPRALLVQVACVLALCLGLFALVELVLRATGVGAERRSTSLAYQEVYPPAMIPGERPDGTPIWRTWDPRLPYQAIARDKAPDALRVFTLGGSATAGLGFSPNVTFARHFEELLARGHPGRRIEVVNLGIVAIASKQVALLVDDVLARYEPDLLVVYAGNNEFLELHAGKYAQHAGGLAGRLRRALERTNLQRALRQALVGAPRPAAPPLREPGADEEQRLTEARILLEVRTSAAEIAAVLARYGAHVEALARSASRAGVPLVLCGVAANHEWRGREDLPEGWIATLPGAPATRAQALVVLTELLARDELSPLQRWEALFQRATLQRELGALEHAREDYAAALEIDPHLRRATARHAELVRAAAQRTGATFLDTTALFAGTARDGIVGFQHFYDYVHFTPRGAAELAAGIYRALQELPGMPRGEELELGLYWRGHELETAGLQRDFADARRFLGIGFEPARLQDRDLWKYDAMRLELEARLASDPHDAWARVYRANALGFRQDGAAAAARDLSRALELLDGDPVVRANLERLLAERGEVDQRGPAGGAR